MKKLSRKHYFSVEKSKARKWYKRECDRYKSKHRLFSWDECEEQYPKAKLEHPSWDCESGETIKEMVKRFAIEDMMSRWCEELSWEEIKHRIACLVNAS